MLCSGQYAVRKIALTVVLVALFRPRSSLELQKSSLSAAVQDLTSNALGVDAMQEYYYSLAYDVETRDVDTIADQLAQQLEDDFKAQEDALLALKQRIELLYSADDLVGTTTSTQCCNLKTENLSQDFNFPINVSITTSCDRVSAEAGPSVSVFGKLTDVYMDNYQSPLKWQYFGSEMGVANIYPAFKMDDCGTFDPRFRPWYTASATPNFKDVVLMVKNSRLINVESYKTLIKAANILVNTLNPRDRLAVLMYNSEVRRPALSGCYASSLSTASPANIVKFQNFLLTAPDRLDGDDLYGALKVAFSYLGNTEENSNHSRDRAIAIFTDEKSIHSKDAMDNITALVKDQSVSLFFFVTPADNDSMTAQTFYRSLLPATSTMQSRYIELTSGGSLRHKMQSFYSTFSTSLGDTFKPVFIPPYYKSGLDQLVSSMCTPCFKRSSGQLTLVGVAGVDLSLSEVLQGMEYFQGDSMTYAFIIDQEGLVLIHPLLPAPTIRHSSAYIHIETLEHATNFSEVVSSMISGEVGCATLTSLPTIQGNTAYRVVENAALTTQYCWRPIGGTPFFLCVANPVNIDFKVINAKSFSVPIQAQYHRLDLLGTDPSTMCSHFNSKVNKGFSTVHLSPEAFERPTEFLLTQETTQTARYIQTAIQSMSDPQQMLKTKVLETVAATAKVNSLWISNQTTPYEDYVVWRYIATPTGVMRIYPGVQLASKNTNIIKSAWYRRAVANLGSTAFSTPHPDVLGTRNVITLSQAIVHDSCNEGSQDYNCSVLAVMAMDITYPSFVRLLNTNTPLCQDTSYRCMVIDGDGFLIAHESFDGTGNEQYVHLSEREPLLSQDMYLSGYLEKIYCYSFQYDDNFTKRPRRKYSYQVTDVVKISQQPLQGGYFTYCVFYSIFPISLTNAYLIVVDQKKTDLSLCSRSIFCACNVDWPCSSIPRDCTCPCYDNIPPDSYNPCQETFQNIVAKVCPIAPILNETIQVLSSLSHSPALPSCSGVSCDQFGSDFTNCTYYTGCQQCVVATSKKATKEQKCSSTCPPPPMAPPNAAATPFSTRSSPPLSRLTTTVVTTTGVMHGTISYLAGTNHSSVVYVTTFMTLRVWQGAAIGCAALVVMITVSIVIARMACKKGSGFVSIVTARKGSGFLKAVRSKVMPQHRPQPDAKGGVTPITQQHEVGVVSALMQSQLSVRSHTARANESSILGESAQSSHLQHDGVEQGSINPSNAGGVWF